ncbi:MAG: redox-sensing transcriptional repressor Rex [Pleomorphochaeta sp.]
MKHKIPIPTIKRFPSYIRLINQYKENGLKSVSATILANDLRLNPIQVRKDLAFSGIEGKPKVGFDIEQLSEALIEALGWNNSTDAILIGAGNLGSALIGYKGFENYGLRIVAAFDKKEDIVGTEIDDLKVKSLTELEEYVLINGISIAILTVPAPQAQACAELLVKCGIQAIWTFAPKDLSLPENIAVQRTDLATQFAVLSAKLRSNIMKEKSKSENTLW